MRFRCLLKERVLRYHPFKAGQIINACCILHNMCVRANVAIDEDEVENEIDPFFQPELAGGEIFQLGQQQRRQLINLYFQ